MQAGFYQKEKERKKREVGGCPLLCAGPLLGRRRRALRQNPRSSSNVRLEREPTHLGLYIHNKKAAPVTSAKQLIRYDVGVQNSGDGEKN